MESIKKTLKDLLVDRASNQDVDRLRDQIKQDSVIQAFLHQHPHVESDLFTRYLSKANEVHEAYQNCRQCPGLDLCPNVLKGHQPELILDKGSLTLSYHACDVKRHVDQQNRQKSLIQSFYVPQDVLKASFKNLDKTTPGREQAYIEAIQFVKNYLNDPESAKGLYFYGDFGVGKTHIMGAILNQLAETAKVESLMVYTPDFFREIRNAIQDRTVEEKLAYIRTVPILVLDDIGAEAMSPWIRDDVLGSILQRRVMDQLPTLFTSNHDYEFLQKHLAYSDKSGTEELKARRIMERIRHYTIPVFLSGKNRRSKT